MDNAEINIGDELIPPTIDEITIRDRRVFIVREFNEEIWNLFILRTKQLISAYLDCEFYASEVHLLQISFGEDSEIFIFFPHKDKKLRDHLSQALSAYSKNVYLWGCNFDLCHMYTDLDIKIKNPYDVIDCVPKRVPRNLEAFIKYSNKYIEPFYGSTKKAFGETFSRDVLSRRNYWDEITYSKIEYSALDCIYVEQAKEIFKYECKPFPKDKVYKNVTSATLSNYSKYLPKKTAPTNLRGSSNLLSFYDSYQLLLQKHKAQVIQWTQKHKATVIHINTMMKELSSTYPVFHDLHIPLL